MTQSYPALVRVNLKSWRHKYNYIVFVDSIRRAQEVGLLLKWKRIWWPKESQCSKGVLAEANTVSLKDIQGIPYIIFITITGALLILITEIVTAKIVRRTTMCKFRNGKTPTSK